MNPYLRGYHQILTKLGMDIPFEHIVASGKASGLNITPEIEQVAQQARLARNLKHLLMGSAIGAGLGVGGYGLYKALKD